MNPFEKHYLDDLEAVELQGVVFHVKLPTRDNKRFQRAVMAGITQPDPDTGEFVTREIDLEGMVEAQIAAFIRTCIRKVEGWDDYSTDKLLAIPDACEDLWALVAERTNEKQEAADDDAKKSPPTSSGPTDGPESRISIAN